MTEFKIGATRNATLAALPLEDGFTTLPYPQTLPQIILLAENVIAIVWHSCSNDLQAGDETESRSSSIDIRNKADDHHDLTLPATLRDCHFLKHM